MAAEEERCSSNAIQDWCAVSASGETFLVSLTAEGLCEDRDGVGVGW